MYALYYTQGKKCIEVKLLASTVSARYMLFGGSLPKIALVCSPQREY